MPFSLRQTFSNLSSECGRKVIKTFIWSDAADQQILVKLVGIKLGDNWIHFSGAVNSGYSGAVEAD